MKPAITCGAAVLFGVLILPVSDRGIQHAPPQQSKEQTRPATESREQYQKRIQAKLDELGREISALETREEAQADQARRELRKQLKELTQQHQATARQYEELKQEGQEAWKKVKPQMDAALDELEKAYERLASRFQEHQR
jgi:Skp family chaperone for outer membrane proteins